VTKDEEEILDVIHRNRIAVWTQDFPTYETCFVHADYTTRWNASRSIGLSVRQGWDDIASRVQAMFSDTAFRNEDNAHKTTVENLKLHIHGDMAWATFDQRYPGTHLDINLSELSREVRVFERHDGKWRIAFWGVMDQSVGGRDAAVIHLSPDGAVTWQSLAATAVLAEEDDLVIRAGKLRIRDSRTDQKLQAAIKWAAGVDGGFLPARGALPIVLEAGEGLPTKVWWLIAENGLIVFSIGDRTLNERRLEGAAVVFGLSAAQKQLAGLVAEGHSLNEIAETMGISPNTARTHLDRVYEKVGVRTQPALVRVLLSTAAPI
jgi:DNA-binding CsgD family transcriptional regulator